MKKFKFRGHRTLQAAVLLQCAACMSGLAGATNLFSDDFKTGYTWGTLPMISQSTFAAQAGKNWQYNSDMAATGASQAGINLWPADGSKDAFFIQYVRSDDLNVIAHKFDPNHTLDTARPTEIYVQWKEYRSSTFDFGPSKDWRAPAYAAGTWGDTHPAFFVDIYGGIVKASPTSGVDNSDATGINIQGGGASQPGDPNVIFSQPYVMPKATVVTVQLHLKMNTPGKADGAAEMWINGTRLPNSRTNVKFSPDGQGQVYLDGFQFGMTATNGGQVFASPSTIWRTDLVISNTLIGDTTTPPAPSAPSGITVQMAN